MFGRRRKREDEEAAREAERRALFVELAKRPDTVCPFLGLVQARAEYNDGVADDHRCYAFGDPAELSAEQQHKVCLQRGYGNCPRYLRGVLVIPTEELEALRRPPPAAPRPAPAPVAASGGGGRRGLVAVVLVLLLLVGGGGAAAFLLLNDGGIARPTPTATPVPSLAPTGSASVEPTSEPTPVPSESILATPTPEQTPTPVDLFDHHEVAVAPGDYTLYVLDGGGVVVDSRPASFDDFSNARVERVERPDGSLHWRTLEGDYTGLSYIYDPSGEFHSGPFRIRAVYTTPTGGRSAEYLPEDEL
ncbi:MAG TPA: hypothetical protein VEW45_08415 [Candidatus Dormibacteraeota bacterium]|nr:hypothetical protein [Candidatus Dormibacteraeota bacterium]